jgi:putative hydrolase of HD superfamily
VINPVKGSVEGLKDLIKEYERQEMQRKIYKLIPLLWHQDMKMFTEEEFMDLTMQGDKIKRDGKLVKGADDLAAFIEAYLALENGVKSDDLKRAKNGLKKKYKSKIISGINFGRIYREFN